MFKQRLGHTLISILAFIVTLAIFAGIALAILSTAFINKALPGYICTGIVVIFLVGYVGIAGWGWIKWQFIEPYKAAKAEKEGE